MYRICIIMLYNDNYHFIIYDMFTLSRMSIVEPSRCRGFFGAYICV